MDDPLSPKSKYNLSLTSLYSIRQLLTDCNYYSQGSMLGYDIRLLNLWKSSIFALYREIYPKLKPKEEKEVQVMMAKYKKIRGLVQKSLNPENPMTAIDTKKYEYYWRLNHKLELLLRKYADAHKMLIVDEEDARWSL